jgi:transposase-like protein
VFFVYIIIKGGNSMRKTIKHKVYTTEEKIQIVLLYIDHHMGTYEIVRKYDLADKNVLYRWVKQYEETGTIVETRGRGTKVEIPNKGRPRKTPEKTLEEMSKEELIERVRMLEDIKNL